MIWIKRALPFVVIVAAVYGYRMYDQYREREQAFQTRHYALATAHLWLARARFRNNPQMYDSFRDSILTAYGVSTEEITEFGRRHEDQPERYDTYARLVQKYVDSLTLLPPRVSQSEVPTGRQAHPPPPDSG